jgi:DNA-binding beta-propeller fold protein YncE
MLRAAVCSCALLLAACASTPPAEPEFDIPVYPPPPAEPRFVWERTLLYNEDVEAATRKQRFIEYATGASRKLKGLVKPFDVAVRQGRVYVSDSVQRLVAVFDIAGGRFFEIGKEADGRLTKPLGLAISSEGTLYVADVTLRKVMAYDADGVYLRSIGGPDTLQRPTDVAVSPDGSRVYVVDTGGVESDSHIVAIFDASSGEHLGNIGKRGEGQGEFNLPLQIAVAGDGTVYVVDSGNFRVQAFDGEGRFQTSFGSVGRFPGQFARPKGIAVDGEGRIYVIDTAFGNFQIFDADGTLLMYAGERGHVGYPGKYMLPAGIAVDEDGRVYVVDQFFRKVDVFRPVGIKAEEGYAGQRSGGKDRG